MRPTLLLPLLLLSFPGGALAQSEGSPALEAPSETEVPTNPEEQRKKLSEALLKIGLCNEEYYGKEFCANLRNKAETAPDATPPLAAPPSTPAVQTPSAEVPAPEASAPEASAPETPAPETP